MYTIFKNTVFFPVIVVATATSTLVFFNLESLSQEPACLEKGLYLLHALITYTLIPTSVLPIICSDHS